MGLFLTLLYVMLSLLSPANMIPELAKYRVLVILSFITAFVSVPRFTLIPLVSRLSRQFWLVVAFILWLAFVWLPNHWLSGPFYTILQFMPDAIVYFFVIAHLRSPFRLAILRAVVAVATLYILFMGFSQYQLAGLAHTDMPYAMVWESDLLGPPRLRGLGVLGDPNIFGQFLLVQLPLLFVSNKPRGMGMGYLFAVPVALVFLVGLYLTGSRGALLGLLVMIGLYLQSRFKAVGTVIGLLLGTVTVVGVNVLGASRTISLQGGVDRLALWSDGIGILKHSPLWGIGYHAFSDNVRMTAHNSYLLCACESGLIGFFLWTGILVITLRQLHIVSRSAAAKAREHLVSPSAGAYPGEQPADPVVLARWAEAVKKSFIVYLFTAYFLSCTYQMVLYLLVGLGGAIFYMYTEQAGHAEPVFFEKWPRQSIAVCTAMLFVIWVSVHMRRF